MFDRRITILVGHFGSGKTEIAVNGALGLAGRGEAVALVDLDLVKPYFRSRSARRLVEEAGVDLVAPEGDFSYADLPIVVPRVRSLFERGGPRVIVDIGGDDAGARVLGSIADAMGREDDTDVLLVLNFRRPLTANEDDAVAMARRIEAVARVRLTGIVSNTHLLDETTLEIVLEGQKLAGRTSRALGVPVKAITVGEALLPEIADHDSSYPVTALKRLIRPAFEAAQKARNTGPLFVLN